MIRALHRLTTANLFSIAALSAAIVVCATTAVQAQYVTIAPVGGDWDISGRVVGFDGDFLRLQTPNGVVTLRYDADQCAGFSCPDAPSDAPVLRIAGTGLASDMILPTLIEIFAAPRGLSPQRYDFGGQTTGYALVDDAGVPALNIVFQSTDTATALGEAMSYDADILLADRELTTTELDRAARVGLGDVADPQRMRLLAMTVLTPVAAVESEVPDLTIAQLAAILSGEITNWAQVGGTDGPVTVHIAAPNVGQGRAVIERVLEPAGRTLALNAVAHDDYRSLVAAMSGDRGAIALVPEGEIEGLQQIPLVDACGDPWTTDAQAFRAGDYPLVLPLYLHLPRYRLPPIAQGFLAEMSSDPAEAALENAGVITHAPRALPAVPRLTIDATSETLAPDDDPLVGMQRLSLTFRFEDGSRALDGPSRLHVRLLADLIRAGEFADQRIVLTGFSDGVGSAERNLTLSQARAREVRRAVVRDLGGRLPTAVTIETLAFGESRQIACDLSVWGRRINRRVEVWTGPKDTLPSEN